VDGAGIQASRKDVALKFASEYNTVLVLKGSGTIAASPAGEYYINETGNPGMASGGTGDVLTGMIAGFIGQGLEPYAASALGVYFHGGLLATWRRRKKALSALLRPILLNKIPER